MCSHQVPIECRSLTKRFDGPAVVDDLSFEVAAGTITGFVGANGAGKTTTMRMILGLVAPSAGEALVNGIAYRALQHPRREVGAVLDGPGAHPALVTLAWHALVEPALFAASPSVFKWLPGIASFSLRRQPAEGLLTVGPATAVLVVFVVTSLAAGLWFVERDDVTA